jgi:hypothetical protein
MWVSSIVPMRSKLRISVEGRQKQDRLKWLPVNRSRCLVVRLRRIPGVVSIFLSGHCLRGKPMRTDYSKIVSIIRLLSSRFRARAVMALFAAMLPIAPAVAARPSIQTVQLNCPVEKTKKVTVALGVRTIEVVPGGDCYCQFSPGHVKERVRTIVETILSKNPGATVEQVVQKVMDGLPRKGLQQSLQFGADVKGGEMTLYCLERSQIAAYIESALDAAKK